MDDRPIVGTWGEEGPDEPGMRAARPAEEVHPPDPALPAPLPPVPSAIPTQEGTVLYDPRPKERLPDQEAKPAAPTEDKPPTWPRTLTVVMAVSLAAAGGLWAWMSEPAVDPDGELPELIPSLISGSRRAITPLRGEVYAPVTGSATVGIRAVSPGGFPMADTVVTFRVEVGAGRLGSATVRTDQDGVARTDVTMPDTPGTTLIEAEIAGADVPSVSITVIATAGTPTAMALFSGDGQAAGTGDLLPERVSVRVTDSLDNPVPGVEVNFRPRSGNGLTAPTRAMTDVDGRASARWRLGTVAGPQQLAATSPSVPGVILFEATAQPRVVPTDNIDTSAGIVLTPVTVASSAFAIGGGHVCVLRAGAADCRGSTERGQRSGEGTTTFVAITSGVAHLCALDARGTAYCWGANESGQLGNGLTTDESMPQAVRTELRFSSITAGAAHTCALAGGGVPACWGRNLSGQLGDGSRNDQRSPRTVGGGLSFVGLAAGWEHTCGVTSNGNAFCWGLNSSGQLGDGSRLDRLVPTSVGIQVEALVAGSAHTCALSAGRVMCWGSNSFGQLGDGTTQDRSQPVEVQDLPGRPRGLTAGAVHTCALMADGTAYCWGQNLQGQVGDGTTQNRARAVQVAGGQRFREIRAGGAATCGRTADGTEYCWGLNAAGQLGDGTRENRSVPTVVTR